MPATEPAYLRWVERCKSLFLNKTRDYGTSWRILRPTSITDQLFIKARRIRAIEEMGENRVGDSVEGEYIGLVNYGVIALMILSDNDNDPFLKTAEEIELPNLETRYDACIALAFSTMQKKNHDYGEAWRDMRISSLTDLILAKLLRIKQIEDNAGKTIASEGVEANYIDIINYALFALIRREEAGL